MSTEVKEPKKISRRKYIAIAGAAVAVVAVGGGYYILQQGQTPTQTTSSTTTSSTTTSTQVPVKLGGNLNIGTYLQFAPALDPSNTTTHADIAVITPVYEPLIHYDDNLNLIPWLAESWKMSDDKLSLTFQIRKGVKWQRINRELTAEDVAYSIDRSSKWGLSKTFLLYINSTEVLDNYTAKINLSRPFPPLLEILANPGARGGLMVPKLTDDELMKYGNITREQYNTDGFRTFAIGTGPFTLEEVIRGQDAKYKKFEDYWGRDSDGRKLPYLDTMTELPQEDSVVRLSNLKAKVIDIDYNIPAKDIGPMKQETDFTTGQILGTITCMLDCNLLQDVMKIQKVRNAIHLAIDKEEINNIALKGFGEPMYAPVPSWDRYYYKVPGFEHNLEQAKVLLKEAGYENGFSGTMIVQGSGEQPDIAVTLKDQLAKVNINIDLKIMDISTYTDVAKEGKAYILGIGLWNGKIEPFTSLGGFRLGAGGTGDRVAHIRAVYAAECDAWIEKLATAESGDQMKQVMIDFETWWMTTAPHIPLVVSPMAHVWWNYVHNVQYKNTYQGVEFNYRSIWRE